MVHVRHERDRRAGCLSRPGNMRDDIAKLVAPMLHSRPSQSLGDVLRRQSLEERSGRARSETAKEL